MNICWGSDSRVRLRTRWKHHKFSHPSWISWRELCLIVCAPKHLLALFHASPSQCVLRSVRSLFNFELMLEETAALAWLTWDYIIKTFWFLTIVAIAKKIRTGYTWTFQVISVASPAKLKSQRNIFKNVDLTGRSRTCYSQVWYSDTCT